jgi:hypothetical protein
MVGGFDMLPADGRGTDREFVDVEDEVEPVKPPRVDEDP